jgi:hypothetical protein
MRDSQPSRYEENPVTRVILDTALRSRLYNLQQPLELCDESGKVLARLIPVLAPPEFEAWEPEISEEELRRREQSDKWYTSEQVLAHLKSLESQQ